METALASSLKFTQRGYRSNPLLDQIRPEVNPKQRWFLALEDLEVLFGGAAGGSKSDSLLMAALQFIDVPGYAAILFRRTYEDLALPGALMDRAAQLLTDTMMVKRDGGRRWEYPGGGVLQFGYLSDDADKYRYQSAEFQFVGFDELTQFPEEVYKYLFSRLRRPSELSKFPELAHVPLRLRAATNPGGIHGEWVKHGFITKKYLDSSEDVQFSRIWVKESRCILCSGQGKIEIRTDGATANGQTLHQLVTCIACSGSGFSRKIFVPARKQDNRFLDQAAYSLSLANLPPQERSALEHGRWDIVTEGNLFQNSWRRNYRWQGDILVLPKPGMDLNDYQPRINQSATFYDYLQRGQYWYFLSVDTASKIKTVNDYTVISVWAVGPDYQLCWIDSHREKLLIPNILPLIQEVYRKYNARFAIIEDANSGTGIIQEIQSARGPGRIAQNTSDPLLSGFTNHHQLTVIPYKPGNVDKVYRAQDAQVRMRTGQVFFPATLSSVQQDCYNELLMFPESAHDDFVDTFSMAGWYVAGQWHQQSGVQPPAHQLRQGVKHHHINRY